MNVLSIVGTRPQFIKLAALDRYISAFKPFNHKIIHSGQHYDSSMSDIFFKQLNIKQPDFFISRDNQSSVQNISNMMCEIEKIINTINIDVILVYGDCDTTLAGALVSNKLGIKLVHIESGLRSYNRRMPEEHNRVLTDHLSDILFCPDNHSLCNLKNENIHADMKIVGNLQIELLNNIINESKLIQQFDSGYSLLTIHRDYNTNIKTIEKFFNELSLIDQRFIFPIHPRTRNIINQHDISTPENIELHEPFSYMDMVSALLYCDYVVTDSGGLQLESWFMEKKCVVMRTETEWVEPINTCNSIVYDRSTPLNLFVENFLNIQSTKKYNLPLNTSKLICNNIQLLCP